MRKCQPLDPFWVVVCWEGRKCELKKKRLLVYARIVCVCSRCKYNIIMAYKLDYSNLISACGWFKCALVCVASVCVCACVYVRACACACACVILFACVLMCVPYRTDSAAATRAAKAHKALDCRGDYAKKKWEKTRGREGVDILLWLFSVFFFHSFFISFFFSFFF